MIFGSAQPFRRKFSYALLPSRRLLRKATREIEAYSLSYIETQEFVREKILSKEPFAYGRPGGTESVGLEHFVRFRSTISSFRASRPYPRFIWRNATSFSGIQFVDDDDLDSVFSEYLRALLGVDLMGYGAFAPAALGWARVLARSGVGCTDYRYLEPWRALALGEAPWTTALEGKRVLVVHPFKETIESQYSRKAKVSAVRDFLPDFDLQVLRPPITLKREGSDRGSWNQSLSNLVEAVERVDFDVAIIGAGAYGLPLANLISSKGRKAIHLAGATQLLFGIRGVRWDRGREVSKYIDSTWVSPFSKELSKEIEGIDGGSYH